MEASSAKVLSSGCGACDNLQSKAKSITAYIDMANEKWVYIKLLSKDDKPDAHCTVEDVSIKTEMVVVVFNAFDDPLVNDVGVAPRLEDPQSRPSGFSRRRRESRQRRRRKQDKMRLSYLSTSVS